MQSYTLPEFQKAVYDFLQSDKSKAELTAFTFSVRRAFSQGTGLDGGQITTAIDAAYQQVADELEAPILAAKVTLGELMAECGITWIQEAHQEIVTADPEIKGDAYRAALVIRARQITAEKRVLTSGVAAMFNPK